MNEPDFAPEKLFRFVPEFKLGLQTARSEGLPLLSCLLGKAPLLRVVGNRR